MFPCSFDYHLPATLDEALKLLAELGDEAQLLAGGHSLVPMMKLRLIAPEHIIDLRMIDELRGIDEAEDAITISAMTTHWEIESSPLLRTRLPCLSMVASGIADPLVRNRGTIGGSLAHADPGADYPAAMFAFDAEMVCVGRKGERRVPVSQWFEGMMSTALREGEILRAVRIKLPEPRAAATYIKVPHPASGFAVVGVAAALGTTPDGSIDHARVAITGAGPTASRASAVEQSLLGRPLSLSTLEAACEQAAEGIALQEDLHCSAERRGRLCRTLARRALAELAGRINGPG